MSIAHMLNHSGTLENRSGSSDRHGNPAFGSSRTIAMRFQQTNKTVVRKDRETEPIDGEVWIGPAETVATGDRLTYNNIQYRVMTAKPIPLGNGAIHHKELLVQLWSYPS